MGVTGIKLDNQGNEISKNVMGVFIAIGHKPNTEIFDGQLDMDNCLLYTSPSPRDATLSRMPSSA